MEQFSYPPRYIILADVLRRRILDGEFKPGDRLPSESELCSANGVSRGTVVRAIEKLVADEIIHRRQGIGSFVSRPSLQRQSGKLLSFTQSASAKGLKSQQVLLAFKQASQGRARQFHCDTPAIYIERLRNIEGVPYAVHRSIIPQTVANNLKPFGEFGEELRNDPDFSLYKSLETGGFKVVEAHERISSRLAGPEDAEHLQVEEITPVMVIFRRSYDATGLLVEAVEAVYLSEFYSYDVRLVESHSVDVEPTGMHSRYPVGKLSKKEGEN